MYSIGQVSEKFSMPVSTLRYYDKEGLFPHMERSSGIRQFSDRELEALHIIECLKKSGLEIKDIKQFMVWCTEGSSTYPQRHELFVRQKE
ncbi:MAG TPA: MerR family transcriptional regulator, partial [Ruminococcaceae bacterium]|nr:MerR family transcriptional regulator [Oscillospiraceae bacterium]